MPEATREPAKGDQRGRPVRVSGRKQDRHAGALGLAKECGALGANRVHHGAHIVHALLECRKVRIRHSVGHPRAAFVEEDEAVE